MKSEAEKQTSRQRGSTPTLYYYLEIAFFAYYHSLHVTQGADINTMACLTLSLCVLGNASLIYCRLLFLFMCCLAPKILWGIISNVKKFGSISVLGTNDHGLHHLLTEWSIKIWIKIKKVAPDNHGLVYVEMGWADIKTSSCRSVWCTSSLTPLTTYIHEPRHVISNNVAFWQV